jgi:hypothetical protein
MKEMDRNVNVAPHINHPSTKTFATLVYSHLSNKRGGVAKFAISLNVEVGINVEDGILWKKLMHNSNKRGVEGGKNPWNQ